jgi:hypothetical protein
MDFKKKPKVKRVSSVKKTPQKQSADKQISLDVRAGNLAKNIEILEKTAVGHVRTFFVEKFPNLKNVRNLVLVWLFLMVGLLLSVAVFRIYGDFSYKFETFSDGGTTFASFSSSGNTFYNPTTFMSSGDVSMAYDLNFTNSTSSTIRSSSPLYIQTESPYANLDINLTAANAGKIYLNSDSEITKNLAVGASLTVVGNGSFAGNLSTSKNLSVGGTFVSVGSSNLVANLNANYLNGISSSGFLQIGQTGSLPYVNNTANGTLTRAGAAVPYRNTRSFLTSFPLE